MRKIWIAVLPYLVDQIGEGVREYLERREARRTARLCDHGYVDGRLCSACFDARHREEEE